MPKIQKQVLGERISLPDGTSCVISLSLPFFSDEMPGKKSLSSFYRRLYVAVRETAVRLSCAVRSELEIASEDENGFSLIFDLFFSRGRELILCHRISDNRLWDGTTVIPPRRIARAISSDGGWYRRSGV